MSDDRPNRIADRSRLLFGKRQQIDSRHPDLFDVSGEASDLTRPMTPSVLLTYGGFQDRDHHYAGQRNRVSNWDAYEHKQELSAIHPTSLGCDSSNC